MPFISQSNTSGPSMHQAPCQGLRTRGGEAAAPALMEYWSRGEPVTHSRVMGAAKYLSQHGNASQMGAMVSTLRSKSSTGVHPGKNAGVFRQEREQNVWGHGRQRTSQVRWNFGSKLLVLSLIDASRAEGGGRVWRKGWSDKPGKRSKHQVPSAKKDPGEPGPLEAPSPTHLSRLEWP